MQNENYLNKDKTQALLDTRPPGTSIPEALKALSSQGYTIEGFNDTSLTTKALGVAKTIGESLVAAPGKVGETVVQGVGEAVGKPIGEFIGGQLKGTALAEKLKQYSPEIIGVTKAFTEPQFEVAKTPAEFGGAAIQSGAYVLPFGKIAEGVATALGSKLAGRIAAGGSGGYATDVGANLQDENIKGMQNLEAGLGTVVGVGVPAGLQAISSGGRILQKTGTTLGEAVTPTSIKEAGILQSYKANKPFLERIQSVLAGTDTAPQTAGKTTIEKGLGGTKAMIGIQAKRAEDKLWNEVIEPALENTKANIDLPKYFQTVRDTIIRETPEINRQNALLEALDASQEAYKGINTISFPRLQKLKEGWAEFVPEKFYKGQNIAGTTNQVNALLADEARQTIYSALGNDVKQAYFDYGNLKGLAELGKSSMTGQKLKGGTGGLLSEIISQGVTPIGTVGGNVIYRTGKGLEFIGNAGAKFLDEALGIKNQDLKSPTKIQTAQSINSINATSNIDNTIPQIEKTATKIEGKTIPKNIEKSVVQVVDDNGKDTFFTIPKGELGEFDDLIDNSKQGIAGENIDGKVYHLTAKTPEQMIESGFEYGGVAKISNIPKQKVKSLQTNSKSELTPEQFLSKIAKEKKTVKEFIEYFKKTPLTANNKEQLTRFHQTIQKKIAKLNDTSVDKLDTKQIEFFLEDFFKKANKN